MNLLQVVARSNIREFCKTRQAVVQSKKYLTALIEAENMFDKKGRRCKRRAYFYQFHLFVFCYIKTTICLMNIIKF